MNRDGARLAAVEVVDEQADTLAAVAAASPTDVLADRRVLLLGVGSVGSAAADALGFYGVGALDLVDPDRLLQHNFARHRAACNQLGRPKVTAIADALSRRFPSMVVGRYPVDLVDGADLVRPLVCDSDVVLVATDGVASRLAANHLVCWAQTPAVFACVLADGAVGEAFRWRPGRRHGCLLCHRVDLHDSGTLDPEPGIDRGYGAGFAHRPMTAVGGDLQLIGLIAAKLVVATLLEAAGWREQQLPGDHVVVGLRPDPLLPAPFATAGPAATTWSPPAAPDPACPACAR